ncbi:WD repeat-containing protein wrap73, partial [Quaeritorhiza haematococci]
PTVAAWLGAGLGFDDGDEVLMKEIKLRVTVWSLIDGSAYYMQYPKFDDRGYCFRSDGKFFALAERRGGMDYISIYNCEDGTMLKHFPVDTGDLENISWSPDGRYIAIWDSSLVYRVLIYYPDGRRVADYSAYNMGLGIKTVRWSPSSQFLAIGSYDQNVRLLNCYTWKPIIEFSHPQSLAPVDITVFKEVDLRDKASVSKWVQATSDLTLRYEVIHPPLNVPITKPNPDKPNPRVGVGMMEFSADGRYLATRNDNMPLCLWIWDLCNLKQIALIQQSPGNIIRSVKWNPQRPDQLAFICGSSAVEKRSLSSAGGGGGGGRSSGGGGGANGTGVGKTNTTGFIYLWDARENVCQAVEVPAVKFQISSFHWNPNGKSLLLIGNKDTFCLAFPVDEELEEGDDVEHSQLSQET